VAPNLVRAACVQLCSTDDINANLNSIAAQLQACAEDGCQLVLLPENATLMSADLNQRQASSLSPTTSKILEWFALQAKKHQLWLITGSMLVQDEAQPNKAFNRCFVFSPEGIKQSHYDKMHLFNADLGSESWQESKHISFGASPTMQTLNDPWKVGLSICYDLRFPELYRFYQQHGCNILTVPAAFTVPTGIAHWLPLLQARAIENQCYVLASGQSGKHTDGRTTYGHSLIIDPWGKVLNRLEEGVGFISADLSLETLTEIRQRMPVLLHRREL